MDRLSLEEVDALVESPRHSQEDNNIAAVAVQLAETMRENERLLTAIKKIANNKTARYDNTWLLSDPKQHSGCYQLQEIAWNELRDKEPI